ncbi:Uncharacterized protein SCF082_LOCUS36065 [Durusdinium trenchii]|uniref:Condensation domain-containing protein n=1 Tax=Durusdinium trenchii TaxID=1381693 RepID=A0ABP0PE94_9DINO
MISSRSQPAMSSLSGLTEEAQAFETSSSSSAEEKEVAELLQPEKLPQHSLRLEQPCSFRHVTVCHCLAAVPEAEQLREALQRVLNKNPVLAGRLRPTWPTGGPRPEGLEIGFEGPVGLHFQVRPLSADMEHQVERLDAERYARQFLQIHTEFADSLGVARVGYGLNLLGKDRPLCMASYCPGAQVSVVALSVSRILGDSAVQALFRAWDEEFQEPDLSAKSVSSREVTRLLYRPILVLQAIQEAWDGVRQWLYQTTISQFAGCCTTRGNSSSGCLMAETSLKETGKAQADADCDSAPEDREFYAIAVRVREETLSSIRAAAAASAPGGGVGLSSVLTSDALYAWLGNVLRLPQFLVADRRAAVDLSLGQDRLQSYVPSAPGRCHALDIRRAINAQAAQGQDQSTRRWSILDFSEVLETVPRFGTNCSSCSFELHDLWQRSPRHVVARCSEREYIAFHCVCRRDQVLALQRGWRSLGEHALSVASEAQLLEALER